MVLFFSFDHRCTFNYIKLKNHYFLKNNEEMLRFQILAEKI